MGMAATLYPQPVSLRRYVGHSMKQRFFLNREALNRENTRIWHTYFKPKPADDHIAHWQPSLQWHRQVVAEVLEIAAEMGWQGGGNLYGNEQILLGRTTASLR